MRRLFLTLAAAAVVLSACGTAAGSSVVATIDGEDITLDEVRALRPDEGSISGDQFAGDLQLILVNKAVRSGAAALGIDVTDQDIVDELELIKLQIETPDPATGELLTWEDFKEQQNLSDALVDAAVEQQVFNERLVEYFTQTIEVSEEDIEAQFNIEQQSRSEVCAAHILLEDEATANDVLALAQEDGADFSALAIEYSTGPSGPNGGVLGCASPANYVPEFGIATLEAPLNEPYGPVQSEFGFHIILVTQREEPVFEEIRDELAQSVRAGQANTAVTDWFLALINSIDVTIDPEYGSWIDTGSGAPTVVPPAGP